MVKDNWEIVQLGDICEKKSSNLAQKNLTDLNGEYPIFGASGFIKCVDFYHCENEYIGIVKDGAGVGRVMLLPEKSSVIGTMQYIFAKKYTFVRYLYLILAAMDFTPYIKGSAIPHIYFRDYHIEKIPLPPLPEQHRIVERIESLFAKLDRAKELAQSALYSFELRKAAILQKAFTGELTAKWREENGVSGEWEEVTARDICGFITKGETPTKYVEPIGEIPFLKVYNIRDNKLDFDYNPAFIPRDIHENRLKRSKVYPNDVIMNIVGPPLQKVAIVTNQYDEWNINQAIAIFRPKERTLTKYLYYCLIWEDTLKTVLHDVRGVVGQSNISLEQCRDLGIPLPTLPEQQEIVRILDSLLEKEQRARECCDIIEKIDLMKKSVLARAFRGELGTNDPNEESGAELLE